MRKTFLLVITAAIGLALISAPLAAQSVSGILESGSLKVAYNPVLLDYLLEEGADDLPQAQKTGTWKVLHLNSLLFLNGMGSVALQTLCLKVRNRD